MSHSREIEGSGRCPILNKILQYDHMGEKKLVNFVAQFFSKAFFIQFGKWALLRNIYNTCKYKKLVGMLTDK